MKILFDHCVPRPLRRELPQHEIKTTREMRWEGLKNGKLLAEAEAAGFDVLLTVDQNLRYQQNLTGRSISVLVLIARGITVDDLLPLIPDVEKALIAIQPGQVSKVTGAENI
ncbi:MAG: hypothetical protein ABIU20_03925 [Blastocatellia bacterium]